MNETVIKLTLNAYKDYIAPRDPVRDMKDYHKINARFKFHKLREFLYDFNKL